MHTEKKTHNSLPCFKRGNLSEMVFEVLRERILDGMYETDKLMPTQEVLAKEMGVSRTVLREAFNKLSSLGLIRSYQGRGTIVQTPDMAVVMRPMLAAFKLDAAITIELMETRYALEASVARLAAKNSNAEQVGQLRQIIDAMEEATKNQEITAIAEADYAFHMKLAEISKNRVLKQIIEVIREILGTFLENINQPRGTAERAVDYHRKICDAVERKELDSAEQLMREHMMDVLNTLRAEYQIEVEI